MVWINKLVQRLLKHERCANRFALSCAVGIYIAFSPFLGFHTALIFLFSWLFSLNFAVVLAVSVLINNPWSMVPVYGVGYLLGDWMLSSCGMNHVMWNPSWVTQGNELFAHYIGFSDFSFWAFMIGGNVLGLSLGLLGYPMIKSLAGIMLKSKKKVLHTVLQSKRAVRAIANKAKPVLQRVVEKQKQYARKSHEISDAK